MATDAERYAALRAYAIRWGFLPRGLSDVLQDARATDAEFDAMADKAADYVREKDPAALGVPALDALAVLRQQHAAGIGVLAVAVQELRDFGGYRDEEGEATSSLADLLDALDGGVELRADGLKEVPNA